MGYLLKICSRRQKKLNSLNGGVKNKFLQSVIYNSSIIFTVLCLMSTLFFALLYWSFDATSLPNLGVNFALLAISYIIAIVISIILYKKNKPYVTHKINFLYFATTLYPGARVFCNRIICRKTIVRCIQGAFRVMHCTRINTTVTMGNIRRI